MASIVKTATGYRAQIYVNGLRKSKSFRLKRDADMWAASYETEIRESATQQPALRFTLKQMLERYRDEVTPRKRGSSKEYIRIEAMIKAKLLPIEQPLQACTPDALGKWRDARLKQVSSGSVLREFSTLSAIFEHARMEWRWLAANPVRDVKKPREPDHREVTISRRQIKAMLRSFAYSPRKPIRTVAQACAVAFLLALRTGMRAGEICSLPWANVYDGYCRLHHATQVNIPTPSPAHHRMPAVGLP